MTVRRYGIQNPFGVELPGKMDQDELSFLVALHRFGMASEADVEEIYMVHLRLIISIVSEFGWRAPHLIQDMVQIAALALGQAIKAAPKKLHDNNITLYINRRVRRAIRDHMYDNLVLSGRTFRRLLQNKERIPKYNPLAKAHEGVETHMFSNVEILEEIDKCIKMDSNLKRREYKKVVKRLRASGYNNQEIAEILVISESYVKMLISDVREKYEKLTKQGAS